MESFCQDKVLYRSIYTIDYTSMICTSLDLNLPTNHIPSLSRYLYSKSFVLHLRSEKILLNDEFKVMFGSRQLTASNNESADWLDSAANLCLPITADCIPVERFIYNYNDCVRLHRILCTCRFPNPVNHTVSATQVLSRWRHSLARFIYCLHLSTGSVAVLCLSYPGRDLGIMRDSRS